jgi:hypothetical protein
MKRILFILLISLVSIQVQAQLENVIVEKYYVADSTDAADTTNGVLEKGAVTYRIYVDLKSGYKLTKLFGDATHAFRVASDASFFNHAEGVTFGYEVVKGKLSMNTLPLDTWLTLGETTKKSAKTYGGILKTQDHDVSFIGGPSSDEGILTNQDPTAGIPLTTSDGYALMATAPTGWYNYGILDINTNDDSTIFGSLKKGNEFKSNDMTLLNKGVTGIVPDSNQILIAQLTTKGKLSFELNFEVLTPGNKIIKYVSSGRDTVNNDSSNVVKFSSLLTYPPSCGCMDPHYLEYNKAYVCQEANSCKTLIVCGCTDPLACNYDSNANVNIPALCCYPGFCNDRDINVVCPAINNTIELNVYPNPADDVLNLQISGNKQDHDIKYTIYDSYGVIKLEKIINNFTGISQQQVDISTFTSGLYWVRLSVGGTTSSKMFMKK